MRSSAYVHAMAPVYEVVVTQLVTQPGTPRARIPAVHLVPTQSRRLHGAVEPATMIARMRPIPRGM